MTSKDRVKAAHPGAKVYHVAPGTVLVIAPLGGSLHSLGQGATAAEAWDDAAGSDPTRLLRNLLAVIHRDDGHYTETHGLARSVEDAHGRWAELVRKAEAGTEDYEVGF